MFNSGKLAREELRRAEEERPDEEPANLDLEGYAVNCGIGLLKGQKDGEGKDGRVNHRVQIYVICLPEIEWGVS
jgi:hypothetical protein